MLAQPLTADYTAATRLNLIVDATAPSPVVDFALVPTFTGYMTGRVVDPAVTPLAGIEVRMAMGLPTDMNRVEFFTRTAAEHINSLWPSRDSGTGTTR